MSNAYPVSGLPTVRRANTLGASSTYGSLALTANPPRNLQQLRTSNPPYASPHSQIQPSPGSGYDQMYTNLVASRRPFVVAPIEGETVTDGRNVLRYHQSMRSPAYSRDNSQYVEMTSRRPLMAMASAAQSNPPTFYKVTAITAERDVVIDVDGASLVSASSETVGGADKARTRPLPDLHAMRSISGSIPSEVPLHNAFCPRRESKNTEQYWCTNCQRQQFQWHMSEWTSGSTLIDSFIIRTQHNANNCTDYVEWIPYDRFLDLAYVATGGSGSTFSAIWTAGPRWQWNPKTQTLSRCGPMKVALKACFQSQAITNSFLNEFGAYHSQKGPFNHVVPCYGITKDLINNEYLLVFKYAEYGNLHQYLQANWSKMTWKHRFRLLADITSGLKSIHDANLLHRDLHTGNLLVFKSPADRPYVMISDLGVCYPLHAPDQNDKVYGIIPYVAPEVLCGETHTQASDVYSLGMVMWVLATGSRPFGSTPHDIQLALELREGRRPPIVDNIPEPYKILMEACWHTDPTQRPTVENVWERVISWGSDLEFKSLEIHPVLKKVKSNRKIIGWARRWFWKNKRQARKYDANEYEDSGVHISRYLDLGQLHKHVHMIPT